MQLQKHAQIYFYTHSIANDDSGSMHILDEWVMGKGQHGGYKSGR